VFLMPFAGAAVGAAAGALRGRLSDSGIDDGFIAELRDKLTPGTSALFVLSSDADIAKVRVRFPENEVELIYADLDEAGAERLRAFQSED
jgi:uncharacterized membrane protein